MKQSINLLIIRFSNYCCNEIFNKIPSHHIRLLAYKYICCVKIGKNSSIGMHAVLNSSSKIQIGNNCAIGQYVYLDGRGKLTIRNNVNIAGRCSIYSAAHNYRSPKWEYFEKEVRIDDDVWIASNTVIVQGIHIKRGAVVAAGSVVVKDVEAFEVVGGNPAKKIGERNRKIDYLTNYFPLFY